MIETIMLIVVIFALSGVFWYSFFYQKEKKLLNRLQQMLDCAIDGELERTEISEEKYSALENSMKQYIDSSFLAGKNQQEQKEVIQKLISDIAHQTLTPISNLKIYGEILSEVSNENQEEIATILEQTEKLDFLIQSLVKLSRMESGIIAVHSEDTTMPDEELTIFRRRNIGFVFQQYNLVPMLNVWENIVLPVKLDGKKIEKGYVNEIIDTLGIRTKLENLPSALSGGQQQRVAIARALAAKPAILLADEPTGGVQLVV